MILKHIGERKNKINSEKGKSFSCIQTNRFTGSQNLHCKTSVSYYKLADSYMARDKSKVENMAGSGL